MYAEGAFAYFINVSAGYFFFFISLASSNNNMANILLIRRTHELKTKFPRDAEKKK